MHTTTMSGIPEHQRHWPVLRGSVVKDTQQASRRIMLLRNRFYRAMLCIRGTSHGPVSVSLSVRPSQVGVLLKRLDLGSHNNTTR